MAPQGIFVPAPTPSSRGTPGRRGPRVIAFQISAAVPMLTRPQAVVGILTVIRTSMPWACWGRAARTRHTFGCMLADDEADQFLATSTDTHLATGTDTQLSYSGNEPIIASSGDREFDYALAQTLS